VIRCVIVLAAGHGIRLLPPTTSQPEAMLPIARKLVVLEKTLSALQA
jgi:UTP-glucose-1-phosphate uridylyltransferase